MSQTPDASADQPRWNTSEFLQRVLDEIEDPIFVKDRHHNWIGGNRAFCAILGLPFDEIIGQNDASFFPPEQYEVFWRIDDAVIASGERHDSEEDLTTADGELHRIWTRKFPIRDALGQVIGLCGIITDITPIKRRQEEVERLEGEIGEKRAIIEAQNSLLEQLSVPVIQVWESILLLPLVGVLDSRRAAHVMENMLTMIARAGAQVIILDITGVPVVDTSVAGYLIHAVQAAQLLGCESVLVGISPEIAQTLVGLGVDFSHITTRATLQKGLEYGLKRLNYAIRRSSALASGSR